ncbi:MAG: ATP-dependent helicase HrpB [Acidobacteria bacterium]|nr:ATP-dependent helicase HrpB [Acidobacteriota bacterium]
MAAPVPLPVDAQVPRILASLGTRPNLVLVAEPGAGKTTRVPLALLESGLLGDGACWVLEPRRLAARLAAARVAEEQGEELGARIGYAVRFEQKVSWRTRLRFVTEGLLLRRLLEDPSLKGIGCVVLDEFHERHLQTDLALALLRRLQLGARPDLRVVVMSATLDPAPVAAYLDGATLTCEGRAHPVTVRHLDRPTSGPLPERVRDTLEGLEWGPGAGHTLVFLPGAREIRACMAACQELARRRDLRLFPLHGELSAEATAAALAPSPRPKILFSTNVAESSVTLEGVHTVLDSGLAREAQHSPWSGLSSLRTVRISQARCLQRGGRAGRQGPGSCLRLFPEVEFRARPPFDAPEIGRADLSEALLLLHALGLRDPRSLPWFERPPAEALDHAEGLLEQLGAVLGCALTDTGRAMAALPLHPRLARLVLAGDALGAGHSARVAAAVLECGDLAERRSLEEGEPGAGDLLARLDRFEEAREAGTGALRAMGLDPSRVAQARRVLRSLGSAADTAADPEEALCRALLRAYPDRLARRRGRTLSLAGGGGGELKKAPRGEEGLLVALEAEARSGASGRRVEVGLWARVQSEWLLEDLPEDLTEGVAWILNPVHGRVERVTTLRYRDLALEEVRRRGIPGEPGVAEALALAVRGGAWPGSEALDRLAGRAAFLGAQRPDLGLPGEADLRTVLADRACAGAAGLEDLDRTDWTWIFRETFGEATFGLLERWAPDHVQLPRRRVKVRYDGESPWIESRLQDFLGMKEGPRIAGGKLPLVLHLLAPNLRAVQVTTDLAGFWQRAYRELRPQLSRRYPRHRWPEDPGESAD